MTTMDRCRVESVETVLGKRLEFHWRLSHIYKDAYLVVEKGEISNVLKSIMQKMQELITRG